ncbi:hypothetical protein, partial [Streptococcus pneumoniae]|uniref:hypothetical protein n=1 Tax=Streptococcus pneumoniae TaxID=1313 RepID=UPI001E60C38F
PRDGAVFPEPVAVTCGPDARPFLVQVRSIPTGTESEIRGYLLTFGERTDGTEKAEISSQNLAQIRQQNELLETTKRA